MASSPAIIGTPRYTLQEANEKAKAAIAENYGADPYEAFQTKNEDVRAVYNKVYCVSKDKVPIFVTRATVVLPHSADKVLHTILDPQLEAKWNVSTVSSVQVLAEQGNNTQIVYQQHKTLSAASAKRDLVIQRSWEKRADGAYWIYGASTSEAEAAKPESKDFVRAQVVFFGIEVKPMAGEKSEVGIAWCLDFGGWLHSKFIEGEWSSVALRLSRIGKNVPTAPVAAKPAPAPHPVQRPTPVNANLDNKDVCHACGAPRSGGKFCGNCGELLSNAVNSIV